ncbi:DUF2840 domain-containing protein [Xanthobacter sp. 126]|uniref:DUF2840 domain-containing protein n=1 Tax=Xanthobacter sp. 126 TaxID=1131814 RepID=UPI00045EB2B0|nr:DUF2840 domain-containing protein [Xanthobacter sp. 126]
MTGATASHSHGGAAPRTQSADAFTQVELTHIEKRIENWIRFGREVREQVLDRRRRVFFYRPGSVFAFVRWASNDFGTITSRIDIVRAVALGEPCQTLPFVRPGGEILLRIEGWPKVERVLQHIDAIEAIGVDTKSVAPGAPSRSIMCRSVTRSIATARAAICRSGRAAGTSRKAISS